MSIETSYAVLRSILTGEPQLGVTVNKEKTESKLLLPGWAAEFGVWSGYSLGIIAEHMPVIGFDSFQGLPEDWRPGFPKGKFDIINNPEGPGIEDFTLMGANRMIITGWFEDTAPTFPFPTLSLVHIDCDLYSSTITALRAVEQYVDTDTIFVFDEYRGYEGWQDHEAKAWVEWTTDRGYEPYVIAYGGEEVAFGIKWPGIDPDLQ